MRIKLNLAKGEAVRPLLYSTADDRGIVHLKEY
jgi:hypothetical protein